MFTAKHLRNKATKCNHHIVHNNRINTIYQQNYSQTYLVKPIRLITHAKT